MPERVWYGDEGNWVRWRTEDGSVQLRDSEVFLPSRFLAFYPDSDPSAPGLWLSFRMRGGIPQCVEAVMRSTDDGREIRASDLKGTDLEELLSAACEVIGLHYTGNQATDGSFIEVEISDRPQDQQVVARAVHRARRNTRRQLSDDRLVDVAAVYQANPGRPTKAVAEAFGLHPRTASLYVRRAKDAGLIEGKS